MTDEKKPPLEPVPDPDVAPEKRTVAVHDDRLWGGPRRIDGLPGRPLVETKSQYFDLLNDAGLRMKDQQESTTGAPKEPVPHLGVELEPPIVVPPMTMEEAHIYGAITAVFRHYDLIETLWCLDCFREGRPHGCRMQVSQRRVLIECRCGHATYEPPRGTTDLVLNKLPNIARTKADELSGSVITDAGPVARPTILMHDMEALLLRRYLGAVVARHKEPRIFHRWCFSGDPRKEDQAVAIGAEPHQLVLVCRCRTLFHQRRRMAPMPLKVM